MAEAVAFNHSEIRRNIRVASEVAALLRSSRPMKVSQLAKLVELSESRLQHLFRRSLGVSVVTFQVRQRLHQAATLLIESDDLIKTVQYSTGFGDAANFARYFRSHFGLAPSRFRTRFQNQLNHRRLTEEQNLPTQCCCSPLVIALLSPSKTEGK
jgi:transcriptional regulator GlxA family with amidase domain